MNTNSYWRHKNNPNLVVLVTCVEEEEPFYIQGCLLDYDAHSSAPFVIEDEAQFFCDYRRLSSEEEVVLMLLGNTC